MNLNQDPKAHATTRKLRRFMGLLMNAEDRLMSLSFDVREAFRFAVREHDRLLCWPREDDNDTSVGSLVLAAAEIEDELHERMGQALRLLVAGNKPSAYVNEQQEYHAAWTAQRNVKLRGAEAIVEASEVVAEPSTLGWTWDRLLAVRARLGAAELPHEYVAPYLLFLMGLRHGSTAHGTFSAEPSDGLIESAEESLRAAVEFALQEKNPALIHAESGLPGDMEFQCMFMGVAYAQRNHDETVDRWLRRGHYQVRLTRLLFAMGYLAARDKQARRLTIKFAARMAGLVEASFGKEARSIVEDQ